MNWRRLSTESHYQTAVAVRKELRSGHLASATTGIEELIDALARSEKRALKSQLVRLILHIIKWKEQPNERSRSWAASIANAREEITDIQKETPSLNRAVVREMWDKCFRAARRDAEAEMDRKVALRSLSWKDVFETDYEIDS
jgi:septal ring factor EnvC (AmiA/AmiB activator)